MYQKLKKLKQWTVIETLTSFFSRNNPHWGLRVGLILFLAGLHFGKFYLKFEMYKIIPYNKYINVEISLDNYIPYLDWTWVIYNFGFAYVIIWGAAGIWRFSRRKLYRTTTTYALLILTGLVLHLAIPTQAPWPFIENMAYAQLKFKETYGIEPLACLPSMHVAMSILPAFISLYVFKSYGNRIISSFLALMVCASVLTAKEHWILDVISGLLLGLVASWLWLTYVHKPETNKSINTS